MAIDPKHLPAHIRKQVEKQLAPATKSRNKYGAEKVVIDQITFDSKAESIRYQLNKLRIEQGQLAYQLLQVPIRLPGGVRYVVDFLEGEVDGTVTYVDVKGKVTAQFRDKKKMVESLYPFKILCIECKNYGRMQFAEVEI